MMISRTFALIFKVFLAGLLLASASAWAAKGSGGGGSTTTTTGIRAGEDSVATVCAAPGVEHG